MTYLFKRCSDDKPLELDWDMGKLMEEQDCRRHIIYRGQEYYRDSQGEIERDGNFKKAPKRPGIARWPIESYALGGAPSQANQLREILKKEGLGHVEVTEDGNPILTGPAMKRKVSKALDHMPLDEFTS